MRLVLPLLGVPLLVHATAATATAQPITEAIEVPEGPSTRLQITTALERVAGELSAHLEQVSFDLARLDFDIENRAARVRLGGGDDDSLRLEIDGDIVFGGGQARVDARLDLSIAGRHLRLEVPTVDLVPRSHEGDRYLELRLPIFEGTF